MDQLGGELADLQQGVVRHVRLSASTAGLTQFLPPLLSRYGRAHPQIQVDLQEHVSNDVILQLREGRADVGVFVQGPDTTGLDARPFRQDELVLVLPAGHRLKGKTPLPFAQALDEDWISLNTGAALLQTQQQAALAAHRPLRLRMQVRSFDAVCHMVAAGLGIALLPKAASLPMIRTMKLGWRPLADPWARRTLLVATSATQTDAAVLALRDFLI